MRNDHVARGLGAKTMPALAAVATLVGGIAWSNAALLVGLGVVALAGSVGPFAAGARKRAEATRVQLDVGLKQA